MELLERKPELESLDAALSRAAGGEGVVLLIEGEAGIGKTTLLEDLLARARRRGFTVGHARGAELETQHAFGIVRQLLARLTGADEDRDAAALADRVFAEVSAIPFEAMPPHRTFATMHGLYWKCAGLASRAPLLLAVDDAHWGDPESLRFINFLGRRLEGLATLVALSRRSDRDPDPFTAPETGLPPAAVAVVRPAALSAEGTGRMIAHALHSAVDPAFSTAAHAATHGNPFLVRALVAEAAAGGIPATSAGAEQVRALGPVSVARSVTARLADLGPAAASLAQAVAVLDRDATLSRCAALAGIGTDAAADAADALVRIGLLAGVAPPAFVHSLVRNAIDQARAGARRAAEHRRAAEILAAEGADRERVCAHLLQCAPAGDPWVTEQLQEGAAQALARGAPASARAYLARAREEPPSVADRYAVVLGLGGTEALLGRPECVATLQDAIALATTAAQRAAAALAVAQVLAFVGDIVRAVELLQIAVDGFDAAGLGHLAAEADAELLNDALLDTRTAAAARQAAARLRQRLDTAGTGVGTTASSALACFAAMEGADAETVERIARSVIAGEQVFGPGQDSPVRFVAAFGLMFVDRFAPAARVIEFAVQNARERGSDIGMAMARLLQSHLSYRQGAVAAAEHDAREVLAGSDTLPVVVRAICLAYLADALLERGRLDEASEAVEAVPVAAEHSGAVAHLLHSRGRVRTARGQLAEAIADLRDCGRRLEAIGARNPGTIPWRSALAEALVIAGEVDEARELAAAEVELARRHGGARALGMSLLALGRCHRGSEAVTLYREAVDALQDSGAQLEHARGLVALGTELSRCNARPAARDLLREGLDLALRCGATALVERARDELIAAGGRPRRDRLTGVAALTAGELRVARLVAEGRTNREVAQALFVTRKTVEKHLASVFGKLGVSSRGELPAALERVS